MEYLFKGRLAIVWAALMAITFVSWRLGSSRLAVFEPNVAISMAVMLFSIVKARFVLREFMEVGHASRWLRWGSDAWAVLFPLTILLIYVV